MPDYNIGVKFGATGLEQLNKDVGSATKTLTGLSKAFVQLPKVDLRNIVVGATEVKKEVDVALTSFQALGNAFVQPPKLDVTGVVDNLRRVPPAISASVASLDSYKKAVNDLRSSTGAGIKVPISVTSLDQLQAKLADIRTKLQSNTDPLLFSKLRSEAARTQTAISALDKSVGTAGKGLGGIRPGANQAGTALQNLGRVAQDAPFGFIGIQNNINPLLESFQRLKTESGSSAGALKALGSSLLGAGGVGLGLSLVTGLITVAVQKYGSLSNAINVVFGLTSNLEQANRDLAKSMSDGAASVAGEVATIQSLVSIAQNKALADSTRQQALDKLNTEYDKYLPKLTLENIETEKVNESVKKLTNSLVRQAQIKGLEDLISKETAKQAEEYIKVLDQVANKGSLLSQVFNDLISPVPGFSQKKALFDFSQTFDKSEKRASFLTDTLKNLLSLEAASGNLQPPPTTKPKEIDLLGKQLSALEKIRKVQQEIADIPTINKKIVGFETEGLTSAEIEELTGRRKIEKALKDVDALIKTSEKIYDLKIKIAARDLKSGVIDKATAEDIKKQAKADLDKVFLQQALIYEATVRVKPTVIIERYDLSQSPEEVTSNIAKALGLDKTIPIKASATVELQTVGLDKRQAIAAMEGMATELTASINAILNQAINDSFVAIGEGIGNAISGGGLKDLVSPLLNVIANALTELGKAVIAYGTAMAGLKIALKNSYLNPYVAIAVGVVAVAAGQALRNKAQKSTPKFANGGIANGPLSGYGVELHGREMIIPLDRLNNAPSFTSKEGMSLLPSINFSGDMFRIMLQKVNRRKGRV
ncbi:hypothetical protein [Flavitalea sp.]|nr:hypothetical protein [Flavitalea sp.]